MPSIYSLSILLISVFCLACAQGDSTRASLQTVDIPPVKDDPYTQGNPTGESMGGESMGGESVGGESMGGETSSGEPTAGEMPILDRDHDLIPDERDNCPNIFNPEQSDIDRNGQGDACAPDIDQDGVPDQWDPAPMDATWPGRAQPDTVYAHTNSDLYALDVKRLALNYVSTFSFDQEGDYQITDIAFDRSGVLWAISYNYLWLCHPQNGRCRIQGRLPTQFNGLSFLPGDLFRADQDILVGIALDGTWHKLEVFNGSITSLVMGRYPNETSSGDAFSIAGIGTFASVKREGITDDLIISLNPQQVDEITDIVTLSGYQRIYGLAGWQGKLFAFDESGVVLQIDLRDRTVIMIANDGQAWWGAGVSSVLYTRPPQ